MASDPPPRITPVDCERFAALVHARLGIRLEPGQEEHLLLRLRDRMLALGMTCPDEYYRHLTLAAGGTEESALLLDSILVNETHFFRTQPQIDALRQVIVPDVIRRKQAHPDGEFRVWSAACSTGEEVYSIAIVLRELLPPSMRRLVLGTDISQRALAAAREGVYSRRSVANVSPEQRREYFIAAGAEYRIREPLRADVCFQEGNLMQAAYPAGFDAVFCRNVLIYFDHQERRSILRRLYEALNPDGYLVAGYAENLRAYPEYYLPRAVPGGIIYKKWSIDRRRQRRDWPAPERRRRALTRFTVGACRQLAARSCAVPVRGLIAPGPDSRELAELRERLLAAVPFANLAGGRVVLELSEVPYLNNHALGALNAVRETGKTFGVEVGLAVPGHIADAIRASPLSDFLVPAAAGPVASDHPGAIPVAPGTPPLPPQLRPAAARPQPAPPPGAGPNRPPAAPPPPPPRENSAMAVAGPGTMVRDAATRRVLLQGEWPQASAGDFKRQLLALLDGEEEILAFDFARVAFMDIALLRELARFCRLHRGAGGTLVIANANQLVRRRLSQLLDLSPAAQHDIFITAG